MRFVIIDNDVSLTMTIFIIISIVLAFIYNSSQMIQLYYYESTRDFNRLYIYLQIINNCIWITYFIEIDKMMILIPILLNTICLIVIGYYKSLDLYRRKLENNRNKLLYNYHRVNYTENYNDNEIINNNEIINDNNYNNYTENDSINNNNNYTENNTVNNNDYYSDSDDSTFSV
jgi:hypothetical protein